MHRLVCYSKGEFNALKVGNVYSVKYSGVYINDASNPVVYDLNDDDYYYLMELRDRDFPDKRISAKALKSGKNFNPEDFYYDYSTCNALIDYSPTFAHKAGVFALRSAACFVSIIIPVFLYLYMLYTRSTGDIAESGFMSIPLLAIFSFPLLLFLMYTLNQFSELSLLNINFSRSDMLKYYCLNWGGLRKSCFIDFKMKRYLLLFGGLSLIVFLVVFLVTG